MGKNYNKKHYSKVISFLDENDWPYTCFAEPGVIHCFPESEKVLRKLNCCIEFFKSSFRAEIESSVEIDPYNTKLVAQVEDFVCRVNLSCFGTRLNFDPETGSLCTIFDMECGGLSEPTEEMFSNRMRGLIYVFNKVETALAALVNESSDGMAASLFFRGLCAKESLGVISCSCDEEVFSELKSEGEGHHHYYEHAPGEYRGAYTDGDKPCYVVSIAPGGSGLEKSYLESHDTWLEGSSEFLRVFDTEAQADEYIDDYIGG